jgi:hypothetical protein
MQHLKEMILLMTAAIRKEHEFQSGKYTLEITEPTAADPTVKIKSTGWLKGDESSKCAVEVEVRKRRFVQQIYLSGDEKRMNGDSVWWTTGDIVNGPFHTNGTLNIQGKPTFLDRVTYSNSIKLYDKNSEPDCRKGPPGEGGAIGFSVNKPAVKNTGKIQWLLF